MFLLLLEVSFNGTHEYVQINFFLIDNGKTGA